VSLFGFTMALISQYCPKFPGLFKHDVVRVNFWDIIVMQIQRLNP